MASEPAEQRTPLRAVQPDAVAAHEGEAVALEAKPVGGVIAGENDENFDSVRAAGAFRDDGVIGNTLSEFPLTQVAADEPEIQHSVSPKRAEAPTLARGPVGRRPRSVIRSGMRSSLRHSLRASVLSEVNPTARASVSGGELFTREVFDVHSEIDKLLGGLKTELDNWRAEFECLQVYWFSEVMCVPDGSGGVSADHEGVHLRTLREFQCLLERHIEETEFDLQDLEQRLKVSEIDRLELQKLLEEGTLEVEHLETRNADAQREFAKRTNHLQTRIKQAEREVHQCRKDMEFRDVELEELRAQVVEASERMHAMESAAAKSQAELKGANSKIRVYEDQIQSVRKDFSGVSDSNTEIQLQCKMLQTSLDSKSDECRRLGAELHCKTEEVRLLSESVAQHEQRISELQDQASDSFQLCLEKKEALQKDHKRISSLEDSQRRLQAEVRSLAEKLREREEEVEGLRGQLSAATSEREELEEKVRLLGKAVDERETDSVKHSKELKKVVSCLEQAKRELREATVSETSLSEQVEALKATCASQEAEIGKAAEEVRSARELEDEKAAQVLESKQALELRMRAHQEETEKSKAKVEESLNEHYKGIITDLEAHYKTLAMENQRTFEGEIARMKELLSERKHRAEEERNAIELSMAKNQDARIQRVKNEMAEKLSKRERELIEERNAALSAMQTAHEKAVEVAAAEAASAAAKERARRFEFEEAQRGRTERAIRDALQAADSATSELRQRFAQERESLSDELIQQEQAFKKALADKEDTILSQRLQLTSRQKELGDALEENQRSASTIAGLREEVESLREERDNQASAFQESIKSRERAMKAELNSRLASVTRVMQEMQMGFGGHGDEDGGGNKVDLE